MKSTGIRAAMLSIALLPAGTSSSGVEADQGLIQVYPIAMSSLPDSPAAAASNVERTLRLDLPGVDPRAINLTLELADACFSPSAWERFLATTIVIAGGLVGGGTGTPLAVLIAKELLEDDRQVATVEGKKLKTLGSDSYLLRIRYSPRGSAPRLRVTVHPMEVGRPWSRITPWIGLGMEGADSVVINSATN